VLVVPAFYLDAQVFRPLVEELRSRGFNAALPPIRWTDWVPTLGRCQYMPSVLLTFLTCLIWADFVACGPVTGLNA
jgi:hypothetical protein